MPSLPITYTSGGDVMSSPALQGLDGQHDIVDFELANQVTDRIMVSVSESAGCDINLPTTIQPANASDVPFIVNNSLGSEQFRVNSSGIMTPKIITNREQIWAANDSAPALEVHDMDGTNLLIVEADKTTVNRVESKTAKVWNPSAKNNDFATVHIIRQVDDASNDGGQVGYVNSALRVQSHVGAGEKAFEWGLTSVQYNGSQYGENVAIYGQSHKNLVAGAAASTAAGPTWAACFEAKDNTSKINPTSQLVGTEIDTRADGPDNNHTRVICDCVHTPILDWDHATECYCGVRVQDAGCGWVSFQNAFMVDAKCDVGLNLGEATIQKSAITIPTNAPVHFNGADISKSLAYSNTDGGLMYRYTTYNGANKTVPTHLTKSGFMDDGGIMSYWKENATTTHSTKYTSKLATGATAPTLGSNKPATLSSSPDTWVSIYIDGNEFCFPVWRKSASTPLGTVGVDGVIV